MPVQTTLYHSCPYVYSHRIGTAFYQWMAWFLSIEKEKHPHVMNVKMTHIYNPSTSKIDIVVNTFPVFCPVFVGLRTLLSCITVCVTIEDLKHALLLIYILCIFLLMYIKCRTFYVVSVVIWFIKRYPLRIHSNVKTA